MKEDLLLLKDKALCFVLSAALAVILVGVMHLDINILGTGLGEVSFTESMQEVLLAGIICIFLIAAKKDQEQRPALLLVAGLFSCMLIREMDFLFGWFNLSWLPLAIIVAITFSAQSFKRPGKSIHGLARFASTQPFVLLMSGLLTILVFSRLFGMKVIWIGMLGEDYPRVVKNFAEEGVELFGYMQCFLASVFYAVLEWKQSRVKNYSEAVPLLASEATERTTS